MSESSNTPLFPLWFLRQIYDPARGPWREIGYDIADLIPEKWTDCVTVAQQIGWLRDHGTGDGGIVVPGEKGDKGDPGLTPRIVGGMWFIGDESTGVKATGPAGANGADGVDGEDGLTPEIVGGMWHIGGKSTGVKATGERGDRGERGEKGDPGSDGATPSIVDGIWYIGEVSTGIAAAGPKGETGVTGLDGKPGIQGDPGADGLTPQIIEGSWWIGDVDTLVPATGPAGENGKDGIAGAPGVDGTTPEIVEGEWVIGGVSTGVPATGPAGPPGSGPADVWQYDPLEVVDLTDKLNPDWTAKSVTITRSGGMCTMSIISMENTRTTWGSFMAGGTIPENLRPSVETWSVAYSEQASDAGRARVIPNGGGYADSFVTGKQYNCTITYPLKGGTPAPLVKGIAGEKGGQGPRGPEGPAGVTPDIVDGIWHIGTVSTNVPAVGVAGPPGKPGKDGTPPSIVDGEWWVGATNTGVKATGPTGPRGPIGSEGPRGVPGNDGKSGTINVVVVDSASAVGSDPNTLYLVKG